MATVFRGTRADVSRVISTLAAVLVGRANDSAGVGRGFLTALGFGALTDIKQAYIQKARGGTDEAGIRWPPLKPSTIANRRIGPRDRQDPAVRQRERIQKRETERALRRFRLSLPEGEARRRAAAVGSIKATQITGRTKAETLGGRQVEILRDTSRLLNSLSPGLLTNGRYEPPDGEGSEEQLFDVKPGQVAVGTNLVYASTHQRGDSSRGIPARPFLPVTVPDVWFSRWIGIANKALVVSVRLLFERGGR